MNGYQALFLLDPGVIFLNHGSFGACPKPVFAAYQAWQRRLEEQPVLFLGREFTDLQFSARQKLGAFLGAEADDLVYIPNATYGVNIIAHSLAIQPGDEILTTDHEYGACDNTWEFICRKTGGSYIHQPISLPIDSVEAFIDQLWRGVTRQDETDLPEPDQLTDRTMPAGGGDLPARPASRYPDLHRWGACAGANPGEPASNWRRFLYRERP